MTEIQLLKSIFSRASELPVGDARTQFLDSACAGNAELRHQVDKMLAALANEERVLEPSTLVEHAAASEKTRYSFRQDIPLTFRPGTKIAARFELIEPIGQGGMGTVWKARQGDPVQRWVAIKFVRTELSSSHSVSQAIHRFDRERSVLAALDHPNIARIIDGGQTECGTPFVVMELVDGVPLSHFLQSQPLDLRQRLLLFAKVCKAIRHAHQKGVIHRDLKPGNILVGLRDGHPIPKIIDFGLAKWLEDERLVDKVQNGLSLNLIVGTPLYMPPERFLEKTGEPDVREDIYSLGVILYELLTGSTPMDAKLLMGLTWNQLLDRIRDFDPERPSRRSRMHAQEPPDGDREIPKKGSHPSIGRLLPFDEKELRGELDWITLKALASERDRRYASVDALVSDVDAYLKGEPVSVAPPNRWYRIRKLLRRHRASALAVSIILACLLTGLISTTLAMFWAMDEKDRAARAETRTQQELARAVEVKRLITRMFEGITPQKAQGSNIGILRDILDQTSERLRAGEIEDLVIQAEMHLIVGDVYRHLGLYDSAEQHLDSANQLFQRTLGDDSLQTLNTRFKLAVVHHRQGQLEDALNRYEAVHSDSCRILGQEHPDTIAILNAKASLLFEKGRFNDSEELFLQVLDVQRRCLGVGDPDTLATMSNLATLYRSMDQPAQSESLYQEVLEARQKTLGPRHPHTLNTINGLANLLADQGRLDEAETLYRQCLELRIEVLGPEHPETLKTQNNLALILKDKGSPQEALEIYEQLLVSKSRSTSLGKEHPSTLQTMNNLAILYAELGRPEEAEELYLATIEARRRVLSANHPDTLASENNLAVLYEHLNRWPEAESLYLEVLTAKKESLGPTHRDTELTVLNLANLYLAMSRNEEAKALFQTVFDQNTEKGQLDSVNFHRAQSGLEKVRRTLEENDSDAP